MAIFDSEKRPRGLRAPSLTAMKLGNGAASKSQFSFHSKKSTESIPNDDKPLPPARPTPSRKELPPPPREPPRDLPPPPRPGSMNPASSMNARRPGARNTPPLEAQFPAAPRSGGRPDPPGFEAAPQQPPRGTLSPATAPGTGESLTPLEDFIPTPEEVGTPLETTSSDERGATPFTLPEVEPVAAPLNKVHFACFQEHRAMPVAQNVWYPVPCMTCHKHDTETRHRCVFCCLRICRDCFQSLQKCQNRSLAELMAGIH